MIKAVLDTNILVSSAINTKGSISQEIYQKSKLKHFLLITSPLILSEMDETLHKERITKRYQYSDEELQEIVSNVASVSYIVPGTSRIEVVRDPDDNKIIAAAIEGRADYIVTRDKDLLDLKEYQEIKIVSPESFIKILRSTSS